MIFKIIYLINHFVYFLMYNFVYLNNSLLSVLWCTHTLILIFFCDIPVLTPNLGPFFLPHFPPPTDHSHDHPPLPLLIFPHFLSLTSFLSTLLSSISLSHISTVIITPTVHLTTGMSHHLHHHSPPPTTSSASTTETFISMAATSILALGFFNRMR